MKKYRVTFDGRLVDKDLSYKGAYELATGIDKDPRYCWKEVNIEPMEVNEADIFWL